jgi:hypothetical protein
MKIKEEVRKTIDLKSGTKQMMDFFEAKNEMLLQDKSITSLFFNNIPATLNENEKISESQIETFKLISTIKYWKSEFIKKNDFIYGICTNSSSIKQKRNLFIQY